MTTYSAILRKPGALPFSAAGLIARFPMSMVGIATILAVQHLYGSYTAAGTVSAANIIAAAVGAPVLSRLVDEHGQARVMLPAILVSGAALAGMVAAAQARAALGLLVVLSAVAGGLGGSMGSLVRSRWTVVLTRPEDIHTAFSLEAALDEVAFVIGPLAATALCTSDGLPVTSGLIAALLLQLGGGAWFLLQRSTEPAPHPRARRRRRLLRRRAVASGPVAGAVPVTALPESPASPPVLAYGGVLAVVGVFLFSGGIFGANDVSVVAFATELGQKQLAGTVVAAFGVGSLIAALVYGSRQWGWPLWKQFAVGTTALALGASTLSFAPSLVVLAILMVVTGMTIAPTVTTGNNIVQAVVDPGQLTEGLAWVGTALNVGVSLGSLVGGHAIDAFGSHGGFLAVAAFGWLSVAAVLFGMRAIRAARPHAEQHLSAPPESPVNDGPQGGTPEAES